MGISNQEMNEWMDRKGSRRCTNAESYLKGNKERQLMHRETSKLVPQTTNRQKDRWTRELNSSSVLLRGSCRKRIRS